jgi:hypothetical protein
LAELQRLRQRAVRMNEVGEAGLNNFAKYVGPFYFFNFYLKFLHIRDFSL